jgi:hypothetical protein
VYIFSTFRTTIDCMSKILFKYHPWYPLDIYCWLSFVYFSVNQTSYNARSINTNSYSGESRTPAYYSHTMILYKECVSMTLLKKWICCKELVWLENDNEKMFLFSWFYMFIIHHLWLSTLYNIRALFHIATYRRKNK